MGKMNNWWDDVKLTKVTEKTLGAEKADVVFLDKIAKKYREDLSFTKRRLIQDEKIVNIIDRAEKDFRLLMRETELLAQIEKKEADKKKQSGVWGRQKLQLEIAELAKEQKIDAAKAEVMAQRLKNEIAFIRNAMYRAEKEMAMDLKSRKSISEWLEHCEDRIATIEQHLGISLKSQIGRIPGT